MPEERQDGKTTDYPIECSLALSNRRRLNFAKRERGEQAAGYSKTNSNKMEHLKKLFTLWLPAAFIVSVLVSIVYIFKFENVTYLGSSFSVETGNFWLNILSVFFSAIGASDGLVVTVFVCSLAHLLIVEVFSIIRLFKLRKIEQHGGLKMLPRFLAAQAIGVGVFSVSLILIFTASLGASFVYAYADLRINVKEALNGTIIDDQEIIKNIQASNSIIDVYDASDEAGAVLAKRGLKKKDKLTTYEGTVLPLLIKFKRKDPEGKSFFIPSTNSVVYTNFNKGKSDKIIIELAFNHLRHHSNPAVSSLFEKTQKPAAVTYLDDQAYAPYVKKKRDELNQKILETNQKTLSDFKSTISSNEKIVSECKANDAANVKLIAEQENDYRQNCVLKVNYSNCSEFGKEINENKKISREAASACQENRIMVDAQYKEFEQLKADVEKVASSVPEKLNSELTSGLYFPDTKNIYMRVIPDQDAFVYLNTLLHEVFHHYSSGGLELPTFINEGLTDYLTYKSFKLSDYEIAGVSGYFKEVQAVMALLEKIPESELLTAYFTNNAEALEASFRKYFPEADYEIFLSKGSDMYKETYQEIGPKFNLGFWDTNIDHPAVQDLRTFLGLEPAKFYTY